MCVRVSVHICSVVGDGVGDERKHEARNHHVDDRVARAHILQHAELEDRVDCVHDAKKATDGVSGTECTKSPTTPPQKSSIKVCTVTGHVPLRIGEPDTTYFFKVTFTNYVISAFHTSLSVSFRAITFLKASIYLIRYLEQLCAPRRPFRTRRGAQTQPLLLPSRVRLARTF